jgi:hypothetical protein
MADNIVSGLFGLDPAQYQMQQRQQRQQEFARDFQSVQLSPMEQSKLAILQGTRAFGRGVGQLLGGEDPQLQKVSAIKQLSSQFDLTSPVGMRDFARSLQAQFPQEAMLAAKRADEMETSGLGRQKTQADIERTQGLVAKEELAAGKEEQLRTELANLPPNATEAQVIEVVRKYGSPDKILQILQRSEDAKLRRAEIAATKGTAPAKPLGASLQKSEDKDIEAIDTYLAQGEALKPSILNLTPDAKGVRKLELGPAKNAKYIAQNALGNSTPESQAYEALKSAVDTAVNLQVSAEKGVQTDKDVLRFANALIAAYGRNDTDATLQALTRYNSAIEKAKTRTEARVDQRRISQKVEPLFGGQQRQPSSPQEKQTTAKTRTLKSGVVVTIED